MMSTRGSFTVMDVEYAGLVSCSAMGNAFVLCYSLFPITVFLEMIFRCHLKQIRQCLCKNASKILLTCYVLPKNYFWFYFNCVQELLAPVNSCFMQCSSSDKLPPTETPYSASATGAVI